MRKLFMLSFLCYAFLAQAQLSDDEWYWGIKAGALNTSIQDIKGTIISPVFSEETYNTQGISQYGFVGGAFFYKRFRGSQIAIQPEITYSQQGGGFQYNDINELEYTIRFNYEYLNLNALFKAYPLSDFGLNFSVGPQVSFIVNNTNLTYESNQPTLGPDLQIQNDLRQVLKGKNNVSLLLGVGFEHEFSSFGITANARYIYGFSDTIETLANSFFFVENDNRSQGFQVDLGVAIPFY